MRNLLIIISLILVDQLTKSLAVFFDLRSLHFNGGVAFGYEGNLFLKFLFPILILPSFWIGISRIKDAFLRQWAIVFLISGFLSNYIERFSDQGVVDFLTIPGIGLIFNIADLYLVVAQLIFIYALKDEFLALSKKNTI